MIPQIKYIDFPKICRLCLNEYDFINNINILDRPELIHIYVSITNNSIKHNDCFPKNICLNCVKKLEDVIDFIEVCKQSHDYLTAVVLHQDDKEIILENIEECGNSSNETICENEGNTENEDDDNIPSDQDSKSVVFEEIKMKIENNSETANTGESKINNKGKGCKKCKRIFNSDLLFKLHMCIQEGKKWRCFKCYKEFTKRNDLQRHLRIHSGSRPFVCTICEIKFTQKSTLNRHISAVHILDETRKYKFECFICEKKFNRKDHLEPHIINCHIKKINEECLENPKQKDCTKCGKSFSLFSYLKHHELMHSVGELPKIKNRSKDPPNSSILCSICGRSFEKRPAYLQHMRRTHGPPIPKSPEKSNDKANKEDRFQCWHCGKIKSSLCNLKVHMRIHTGEKPYECKFCKRTFSAWNSWHDHENIHLNVKPYQCEICYKVFRQRSCLRKHLRSSAHGNQNKIDV